MVEVTWGGVQVQVGEGYGLEKPLSPHLAHQMEPVSQSPPKPKMVMINVTYKLTVPCVH